MAYADDRNKAQDLAELAATGKLTPSYKAGGFNINDIVDHMTYTNWLKEEAKKPAPVDDRYKILQQAQIEQANKFRADMPNMANSLMLSERENSRKALASKMIDVNRSSNRRGLLYGGSRLAGRAGAATESAQGLQQKRGDINLKLSSVADSMQNQAIETGFGITGAGQNALSAQDAANRQSLAAQLGERQDYFKGLGNAVGQFGEGIGTAFGQRPIKKELPATSSTEFDAAGR